MPHGEIMFFFFFSAFVYASVGFGGGSSYLAILALYELPFIEIRLTALLCNIVVVTGGTVLFIRNGHVNWQKIVPLAAASVPMAFFGAALRIEQQTFFVLLGCSLLVAAVLMWSKGSRTGEETIPAENKSSYVREGVLGGSIGFLSGILGIGGGIFLSPLLNLSRWDTSKRIAATASIFILVNSLSGIAGQLSQLPETLNYRLVLLLCVAVFAGGQLGSRLAIRRFNPLMIRRMTAVLIFVAGIEVLYKHLQWFN
jgi:uncharacterized membrane protein YfcA